MFTDLANGQGPAHEEPFYDRESHGKPGTIYTFTVEQLQQLRQLLEAHEPRQQDGWLRALARGPLRRWGTNVHF